MTLVPFSYGDSPVRLVMIDGAPHFVAADVCDYFGVTNRNRALQQIDAEDKGGTQIDTPGGRQTVTVLTEPGLYALLFALQPTKARGISEAEIDARVDQLRAFRRWVTHEVLPSIRKRGMYATASTVEAMLADPDTAIRLLSELKEERAQRAQLEARAEADRPKVIFADAVAASKTSILVGDLAKMLRDNGIETGAVRLFKWMRANGFLIARNGTDYNRPTQRAIELGVLEIKETVVVHSDGHTSISITPKVTGKGQGYFIARFLDGRFSVDGAA